MTEAAPSTRLRDRLRSGAPLIGTFVKLPALESVDLIRSLGFDLATVDGEHSQLDEAAILALLRHGAALGLPMLVRTPTRDAGQINRMLEAGAAGIQLSTVRSRRDRNALVAATRYAPDGTRSVSLAHPQADYSGIGLAQYLERSKAFPLLVAQVETATNDDPLDDVLSGVDCAFLGTTDLSVDIGSPGKLDDERVKKRVTEIAGAAKRAAAALGAWVANAEQLASLKGQDFRYVLVGSDVQFMRAGLANMLSAVRQVLA